MHPAPLKGKLVRWNDERGFGFIAPDGGGSQVFLHIHAIRNASRRPQTGDTLVFELETQADGRVRATNAILQGVPLTSSAPKPRYTANRRPQSVGFPVWLALVIVAVGGAYLYFRPQSHPDAPVYRTSPTLQSGAPPQPSAPKTQKLASPPPPPQARPASKPRVDKPTSTTPHFITEESPSESTEAEYTDNDSAPFPSDGGSGLIKGNISFRGEKLYHTPDMRDYSITVITPDKGERYFQTEEDAIAAGWRRAIPKGAGFRRYRD